MAGKALRKILALFTASFGLAGLLLAGAAPSAAEPTQGSPDAIEYVNLGDSYSAGFGSGAITAGPLPGCFQTDGVSHVDAIAGLPGVHLAIDAACAGFTSGQVAQAAAYVSDYLAAADLVTLSVGGNDIAWSSTLMACSNFGNPSLCESMVADATEELAGVTGQVQRTLAQLDRQTAGNILVLGYPRLLTNSVGDQALITAANARKLNKVADSLNRAIRDATQGTSAKFIPVLGPFNNNAVGSRDSWLYLDPGNPADSFNFHPTTTGYLEGYFHALRPHLQLNQLAR
ncbi:GDSL-type esterase/lipase family protein [Glutamicibacter sp.]|uniref:GDSL-type esterase/lipase family protein n=1 Tax=Glutamicibacter sp. TaxID=1931995 RepID=UPI003D6B8205